jgi:hypothetical protein
LAGFYLLSLKGFFKIVAALTDLQKTLKLLFLAVLYPRIPRLDRLAQYTFASVFGSPLPQ